MFLRLCDCPPDIRVTVRGHLCYAFSRDDKNVNSLKYLQHRVSGSVSLVRVWSNEGTVSIIETVIPPGLHHEQNYNVCILWLDISHEVVCSTHVMCNIYFVLSFLFTLHFVLFGNIACFAKIISSNNKWWGSHSHWRELCRVACEKMSIWCYLQFGVRPFNLNLCLKAPVLWALDFITFDWSADFLTT